MKTVGRYTYSSEMIMVFYEEADLIIGSFCSIGKNIQIYLGGNHKLNWISMYPFGRVTDPFQKIGNDCHVIKGDVTIGNDVWIADNVVIMSGVKIGDGAVIANNSHVVKDVEPYSIVGGNPAKFIKYRFSKDQIAKLLEIQWWNWSDEKINEYVPLLCNPDINGFIQKANGE